MTAGPLPADSALLGRRWRSKEAARIVLALACTAALASCQTQPPTPSGVPPAGNTVEHAPTRAHSKPWQSLGRSLLGRPILVAQSGSGPLRVLLLGGIHGDETEGRSALDALKDTPMHGATIRIVRDLNPDGTAARTRGNARGHDLNRNWPAANFTPGVASGPSPLSEPETQLLHRDIRAFAPHVVVALHSSVQGPFVNFDGPADRLAETFARAANATDPRWTVRPSVGYETPGSLGSYLGVDQGVPTLTIEFERGHDRESARRALEHALAATIRAAGTR